MAIFAQYMYHSMCIIEMIVVNHDKTHLAEVCPCSHLLSRDKLWSSEGYAGYLARVELTYRYGHAII